MCSGPTLDGNLVKMKDEARCKKWICMMASSETKENRPKQLLNFYQIILNYIQTLV